MHHWKKEHADVNWIWLPDSPSYVTEFFLSQLYYRFYQYYSAFHLICSKKTGCFGGKSNGTGISTGNFSERKEYLQRYSSFLFVTGIIGNHCSIWLDPLGPSMLLHDCARILPKNMASFAFHCPTCRFESINADAFIGHRCEPNTFPQPPPLTLQTETFSE